MAGRILLAENNSYSSKHFSIDLKFIKCFNINNLFILILREKGHYGLLCSKVREIGAGETACGG